MRCTILWIACLPLSDGSCLCVSTLQGVSDCPNPPVGVYEVSSHFRLKTFTTDFLAFRMKPFLHLSLLTILLMTAHASALQTSCLLQVSAGTITPSSLQSSQVFVTLSAQYLISDFNYPPLPPHLFIASHAASNSQSIFDRDRIWLAPQQRQLVIPPSLPTRLNHL